MFMPDQGMIRLLATPEGCAELRRAGRELLRRFARRGLRRLAEGARGQRELRRLDGR